MCPLIILCYAYVWHLLCLKLEISLYKVRFTRVTLHSWSKMYAIEMLGLGDKILLRVYHCSNLLLASIQISRLKK